MTSFGHSALYYKAGSPLAGLLYCIIRDFLITAGKTTKYHHTIHTDILDESSTGVTDFIYPWQGSLSEIPLQNKYRPTYNYIKISGQVRLGLEPATYTATPPSTKYQRSKPSEPDRHS
jgi:hypothetical protein